MVAVSLAVVGVDRARGVADLSLVGRNCCNVSVNLKGELIKAENSGLAFESSLISFGELKVRQIKNVCLQAKILKDEVCEELGVRVKIKKVTGNEEEAFWFRVHFF
eukprot:TRINITY_DN13222_c0_g1_i1.p4 TRINITY_DN13222_c0_g1~~TRINITY_DN13222_c0_g1_i1.p4  ORF type:complete len:106 (-),score=21.18 TRINITY_DN13222_c0_g1_i1:80-397(-)